MLLWYQTRRPKVVEMVILVSRCTNHKVNEVYFKLDKPVGIRNAELILLHC